MTNGPVSRRVATHVELQLAVAVAVANPCETYCVASGDRGMSELAAVFARTALAVAARLVVPLAVKACMELRAAVAIVQVP